MRMIEMDINFYCIGSSKCGTSTVHDILMQHPNIFLPDVKETKFLSLNYAKGVKWYLSEYFKEYKGERAVGEIYPCLALEDAPKRLYESFGKDLKIFVMLRNPVKRLYSNYKGQYRIGKISLPFEHAIESSPVLLENSLYARNIKRFLEYFPIENFRFFVFEEEFISNRARMIDEITDFLGVERFRFNLDAKTNSAWQPRYKILHKVIYNRPAFLSALLNKMFTSKMFRQKIRIILSRLNEKPVKDSGLGFSEERCLYEKYFKSDVFELEHLIRRDLSVWYRDYF